MAWYERFFRDDEAEAQPVEKAARAIGDSGAVHYGGFLITDETLPELNGPKRYETFLKILRDTTIAAAGVRIFLNLISGAIWQAEPPEGLDDGQQAQAEEIAEAIEDMMADHKRPWPRIIRRIALFRFYGFALAEWVAKKRDDGLFGIDDVMPRPQRTIARWDIDDNGDVRGVWQYNRHMREVYLPRDRLIYAVDDTFTESPEGIGLLRHIVRASERLKAFEAIEQVGFENDLRGVPVAYGPWKEIQADPALDDAKRQRYRKPLIDFVTGHIRNKRTGLLLDSEVYRSKDDGQSPSATRKWAIDLLRGDSNAFEPMAKAIERLNGEIARVLGMEHLMLGADGSGSLALSKSKVGTFYLTLMTTQAEIIEIVERDWLHPICEMNGWPRELWPSLACEEIRDEDIEKITTALEKLARAGATLEANDPAVAEVYHILGLSAPPERIDPALDLSGNPIDPTLDPSVLDPAAPIAKSARRWVRSRKRKGKR